MLAVKTLYANLNQHSKFSIPVVYNRLLLSSFFFPLYLNNPLKHKVACLLSFPSYSGSFLWPGFSFCWFSPPPPPSSSSGPNPSPSSWRYSSQAATKLHLSLARDEVRGITNKRVALVLFPLLQLKMLVVCFFVWFLDEGRDLITSTSQSVSRQEVLLDAFLGKAKKIEGGMKTLV